MFALSYTLERRYMQVEALLRHNRMCMRVTGLTRKVSLYEQYLEAAYVVCDGVDERCSS
jgi:hypothetical protein